MKLVPDKISFRRIALKSWLVMSVVLLLFSTGFCQTGWRDIDYRHTTCKNFRSNPFFSQSIDFDHIDYRLLHAAIFYVTNEIRIKNKRMPLAFALELERAAHLHAKSMVEQDFFSHDNPYDKNRRTPEKRARLAGIKNPFIAENIATHFGIQYQAGAPVYPVDRSKGTFSYNSSDSLIPNHTYLSFAEAIVKQWMESSGHRANILSKDAVQLGCGAYFYRDPNFHNMPTFKAVQNFQLYRQIVPGKGIDRWP
ncbi:MAG: CAP domain-containing protein [candidate division KSB1 bacterium]|nr:CAP domain-containing protein [candidate division KSB1 bacterium]MDZ7303284.1 CAP domain-containing protein [candidate division KSB1 bacterium]MDZ7312588.1 CAP domain-containing protein [candidate division KSB1 bacterium]